MRYYSTTLAAGTATILGLVAAMIAPGSAANAASEPSAELIKAAKAEGTVVFYSANPVPGTEHVARAFEKKYGITVEPLGLPAGTLLQRFASELTAGSFNADIIIGAGFDNVVTNDYGPKGWMIPIKTAGIPALDSGSYPADFLNKSTATIAYNPWILAYNTDLVKEADAPKSFADLADPKYKGLVCMPNPEVALAYIEIWDRVRAEFGEKTLAGVAANNPKVYESAAAASSALGAGECAIAGPVSGPGIAALPKRAPVKALTPAVTTGTQMELGFINPKKVGHPNAAKLFAQYLLSPEGNEQQATIGDNIWVLDPSKSPAQIAALKAAPDAADRKEQVLKLLGRK
ncbi:ABC transporter substrate-binding protein [Microvirga antarctica]|uniref:ABC transporter substrate-binding protein n=1 Tax=Microvirga antarctica TaxID=2819233 RepID=UPI001B30FCAE|nr:extracellular solute-binding protein [Microvirga antarctica]